ncbi:MAG TPA: hypothetical protein DGT23_20300 [Micromonosporaceae bacterium]|nr:hypothetical protein [Micromonosporaceae bacterium]
MIRKPLYAAVVGVVLLLTVACGFTEPGGTAAPSTQGTGSPRPAPSATDESVEGDLEKFKAGDCLTINEAKNNEVKPAKCTVAGAFKVLLRKDGTISEDACAQTDYTETLYSDDPATTSQDLVLCIAPVK